MGFIYEERPSDSPYVELVTRGRTAGDGTTIRPAECHWHMVFVQSARQLSTHCRRPPDGGWRCDL